MEYQTNPMGAMMMEQAVNRTYICKHVDYSDGIWYDVSPIALTDVVTGEAVQEETLVKACWDNQALYVRFECTDSYAVSDFKNRNDPLYEQDVVEVFIDEAGNGKRYVEIVVSPNNIVYEVMIDHNDENDELKFSIDRNWVTKGLVTSVDSQENLRIYTMIIPLMNFNKQPTDETEWKINFYRIDEEKNGKRHFQAWSPSGAINFHVSSLFGTLRFSRL